MNPTAILKLGFMSAVPLYCAVAYLVAQHNKEAAGDVHLLLPIFAVLFALQVLIAPLLARSATGNLPVGSPQRATTTFVLRAFFYEAGAIYGLVLSFISHDFKYSLCFGIPALLLLLLTPTT